MIGARYEQSVQTHPFSELIGFVELKTKLHTGPSVKYFRNLHTVQAFIHGSLIATPTHLQAEHALFAAIKGWDILIEIPVTETLQEAEKMVKIIITQTGVASLVDHLRCYHKNSHNLKHFIQNDEIVAPVTAILIWAIRKPDAYFKGNWRSTGGIPVMINLVHDVDV